MNKLVFKFFLNYKNFIYCLLAFYFGAFVSALLNFTVGFKDEIELSFDIGSVISVISSVLLALYITTTLSKKYEENRYIKDLAVQRLQRIDDLVLEKIKVVTEFPDYLQVIKILSNLRMRVLEELKILKEHKLIDDGVSADELTNSMYDFWSLFSGDEGDGGFPLVGNEFFINAEAKETMFRILTRIHKSVFELQIEINSKD